MLPSRLMAAMSVRMRLIVLSLIPVVGFAAVGFSYISSEHTVEAAFGSVRQSARLAESSRAFKDALITMQMRAKEYAAQPQPVLISRFGEADGAIKRLRPTGIDPNGSRCGSKPAEKFHSDPISP